MKLYENGEVRQLNEETQEYELVGRHTVDLEGLFMLTDERGTYASFGNPLPKEVQLFADAEKNADFLLKQLYKLDSANTVDFLVSAFGQKWAAHMYLKWQKCPNWEVFYHLLDDENSKLFIKALVRL